MEELEDEPDSIAAESREPGFAESAEVGAGDGHASGARPVEAGDQVEQRRLAAAGWPHDRCELALFDGQRHAVQRASDPALIDLRDVGQAYELAHFVSQLPPPFFSESSSIHLMSASV